MPNPHMWGDGTERALDRQVAHIIDRQWRAESRELMRARWWAQYVPIREVYLETLPELSRIGRLIWIHARRAVRGPKP